MCIDGLAILVKMFFQLFTGSLVHFQDSIRNIDQCHQTAVALYYHTLVEDGIGANLVFRLFREYVLAIRGENHVFLSALDIKEAIIIHNAQVASTHPAIGMDDLIRCLLILVITQHDMLPFDKNLSRNIHRVVTEDFYFHIADNPSARSGRRLPYVAECNERTTLSHSITYIVRELDILQDSGNLLVQWGPA